MIRNCRLFLISGLGATAILFSLTFSSAYATTATPQLAPTAVHLQDSGLPTHQLELDLTSQELRERLPLLRVKSDNSVDQALALGERLLQWLDILNSSRSDENKLRLTSPKNRVGYPISAPNHYSPSIIATNLDEAKNSMPPAMREILFSSKQLPITNPVSDEDFVLYGRKLDRVYQTAARWSILIQYKRGYIANRVRDVRGYYFLKVNNWNIESLNNWNALDTATQAGIKDAFLGICINSRAPNTQCAKESSAVNTASGAIAMYNKYFSYGRSTYNNFFEIQNAREDITWSQSKINVAAIPFITPQRAGAPDFIKLNLEDEYHWLDWGLKVNFINTGSAPYIEFIPGVTANVNGLGGNRIQMDANKSLNEYEEQWTIRHEFGHVLGFPDCYHEFYDNENEEFINYQIDTTDLMCSRAGNFNERMYNQLKATYETK